MLRYYSLRCLHIFLIFNVLLGGWQLTASAQTVNFPDDNLAAAVRSQLGLADHEDITIEHMKTPTFTYLDCWRRGITDLTGLEHATNLTHLDLSRNPDIDFTTSPFAALTKLTRLILLGAGFSDDDVLELAPLTTMMHLQIDINEISDSGLETLVDDVVSKMPDLESLHLSENQITNIDALSSLTSLEELNLHSNNITDITALGNLTNLKELHLHNNNITDITALGNLTGLNRTLDISNNLIEDISPLESLTQLIQLRICPNPYDDPTPILALTALTRLVIDERHEEWAKANLTTDFATCATEPKKVPLPPAPKPETEPETETEPEATRRRHIITQCGLGWSPQSQYKAWGELPKVMIYALEFEYDPERHGRYTCKTIEIRTGDDSIENLAGWSLYLGTRYNPSSIPMPIPEAHSQITDRILRITPEMLGLETFPCNIVYVNGISHPLPGVNYVLKTDENILVDTAYSCFLWGQNAWTTVNGVNVKSQRSVSSAALREMETPRLERYIWNNIGVFITYMDIEAFTWDRVVLSDWLLPPSESSAPGAPSVVRPKLTTTWGALKQE